MQSYFLCFIDKFGYDVSISIQVASLQEQQAIYSANSYNLLPLN